MARTPLMNYLLGVYRCVRGAARAGVPLDEYLDMQAQRALSRRQFLGASAAVAGTAVLAACGDEAPPPMTSSQKVVIVGGGIAGLHCAYRLKKLGVAAAVYEAGPRLGGRMFTDRTTFADGMHCELGGELIDSNHKTMLDLARELSIDLHDYQTDDPALARMVAYIGGERLKTMDILTGFMPIAMEIDKATAMLKDPMAAVTYKNPNGAEKLDALSLKAWLDQAHADGPVRKLIEVAYVGEFGLELDVSNALNLLLTISTDTMNFSIYGMSDQRFHAKQGSDVFISKLAAALDPAQLNLGSRLVALRKATDGRYTLSLQRGGVTFDVSAEHVVLALPFSLLREVDLGVALPAVKLRAIREIGYGTNSKLMAGFRSRPWRLQGSDGSVFSDLPFQSSWETSRLQPGASGIITNFTGGKQGVAAGQGTPKERLDAFLLDFDKVYPGARAAADGQVARMFWPGAPFSKGSYAGYRVGQYTAFSGAEIERFENLHFCGEHTSQQLQGYMEGGALTGAQAAQEVAGDLGMAMKALAAA